MQIPGTDAEHVLKKFLHGEPRLFPSDSKDP